LETIFGRLYVGGGTFTFHAGWIILIFVIILVLGGDLGANLGGGLGGLCTERDMTWLRGQLINTCREA